jgi:hypothetical protein
MFYKVPLLFPRLEQTFYVHPRVEHAFYAGMAILEHLFY